MQRTSDSSFVSTVVQLNVQLNHTEENYINYGYGAAGGTNLNLFEILKALSKPSAKPEFHPVGLKFTGKNHFRSLVPFPFLPRGPSTHFLAKLGI